MSQRSACAELADTRVELALGLLSGTDRAAAVSHLAGCHRCSEEVDDISRVVDQLALLAPQAEPPAGFETRVLAAVAGGRVGRRARPGRPGGQGRSGGGGGRSGGGGAGGPGPGRLPGRLVAGRVAAMVAVVLVGLGLVVGLAVLRGDQPRRPVASPLVKTALAVSPSGRATCRVVVTGANPAVVLVSLDAPPEANGGYDVAVQQAGGPTIDLGYLRLVDGHGVLARSVPVDAASLTTMLMYGEDGKILYEAPLTDQDVTPESHPLGS
jgi:anti-sigma factor RsiW